MIRKFRRTLQKRTLLGVFVTALTYGYAFAMPIDGRIVMGSASISQNGQNMQITQNSSSAVLNWQGFNIAQGEQVNFLQPNSSSVALNRVLGNDPSKIFGQLTANGRVFLINPNGILFGSTARVDVGGLVASTLNISDSDFMAGRYSLLKGDIAGSILNQGNITAADGGYVALVAPNVQNEGNIVVGKLGTVALASGNKVTLNMQGDNLISLVVDEAAVDALVANKGLIKADGGTVIMTAKNAGDFARTVVNNEGVIEAKSLVERDGKIVLEALGNNAGIANSGILDASGVGAASGGSVKLLAMEGVVDTSSGSILARGGNTGGDGGFAEVSGKVVQIGSSVDLRAPHGHMGDLLIDPANLFIVDGAAAAYNPATDTTINDQQITALTTAANLTLQATNNINSSATTVTGGGGNLTLQLIAGGTPNAINTSSTPISLGAGSFTAIATGSGKINLGTITATGVTITGSNGQVDVRGITSNNANVSISNTAGNNINLLNAISAGSGSVTVNSAGGAVGTSVGADISGSAISLTAGGGSLTLASSVTATGTIDLSSSNNIAVAGTGTVSTTNGQIINLKNMTGFALTGTISAGATGTINIVPTGGATVGLGGGTGSVQVANSDVSQMTAGTLNIGNGTNNYTVDVATVTPAGTTHVGTLNVKSGSTGTITQTSGTGFDLTSGSTNITLQAGGGIGTSGTPVLFVIPFLIQV